MKYRKTFRGIWPRLKQNPKATLLLMLGLVLIGFSIHTFSIEQKENRQAADRARHDIALANAGKPSPAPATTVPTASEINSYTVPASHPRYLIIPKLGVKARVISVGETSSGAIGTPSNVNDTAWFNQTSLPGQPGAVLIDGHVSSWTSHGVFYGIKTLGPGDTMSIERGDGVNITYKVIKLQVYDANMVDINSLLAPVVGGHPGLNLITCTGDVIKGTNNFNERVVVYTEQT